MAKYNHKQNITWRTYDGDDILEEVETLVSEKNAPMTFIDALEVVRSTIKYNAEKYDDCVNSTYYSFNDTSNGKVMGIYSEFEHFKSLDIGDFNSEIKTLFKKFDSFYDSELEQYHTKRVDDLPTNLKNKLEELYDDLGVLVSETIEKEFQLTMKFVDEMVKKFNDDNEHFEESFKVSFRTFINESTTTKKSLKLNEAKISTKSDLLTDVYNEVFANNINDTQFIAYEEIAEYLGVDFDDVIDSSIDVFKETIKTQKGYWQLSYIVQGELLQSIVNALDEKDIKADYYVSSPSFPSLVVNGDEIKTLKELKQVLKELDKDD